MGRKFSMHGREWNAVRVFMGKSEITQLLGRHRWGIM
jgi:hypothetical protein